MAQQTYEPLINPEGNVFCANYDVNNAYQRMEDPIRPLYTQEVVDYFFKKEIYYITKFQHKAWAPEILDIDYDNKQIFFKWYKESCNEIIYSGRQLKDSWKDDIKSIMLDCYASGVYKLTMYPHCHFYDDAGQMHTLDMYGCVETKDPYIQSIYMDGIIHESAKFRLEETGDIVNGQYNLKNMFKRSLKEHVKWGEQSMEYIYKEIFNA